MGELQDRFGHHHEIALYLGDAVDAGERHGHVELRPEDVEHPLHAPLSVARQPPDDRAADEGHPGAEGEGLQHVGAQGDAPVEVYLVDSEAVCFSIPFRNGTLKF